jgi:hypothetical protein
MRRHRYRDERPADERTFAESVGAPLHRLLALLRPYEADSPR